MDLERVGERRPARAVCVSRRCEDEEAGGRRKNRAAIERCRRHRDRRKNPDDGPAEDRQAHTKQDQKRDESELWAAVTTHDSHRP